MKRRILSSRLPASLLPLLSLFILVGLMVFSIGAAAGSQKRQRKLKKTQTHVVQTSRADKDAKKKKASIRDDFDEYRSQEGGGEEENDDALARQNWFMFQRTYPSDSLPDEARQKAWDARPRPDRGLDFVSQAAQAATGWIPIGPVGSLAYLPLRPNFGINSGRINAIAVSPVDPNLILIGASTGGIWRSTDGGAHFTAVTDSQTDLAVGGLAFAKSNSQIVYAGMGDAPDSVYFGTGVLKSTDAGLTWTKVSAQCASNAPTCLPSYGTTWKIETDANDANRVYIAQRSSKDSFGNVVRTGFFVSTDGGVNWTKTFSGSINDFAAKPNDPQTIYAVARFADAPAGAAGLYRSTNAGLSWTAIPFPAGFPTYVPAHMRLAVSASDPSRLYVYLGNSFKATDLRLESISFDAGGTPTWTNNGNRIFSSAADPNIGRAIDGAQFGYNSYLVADPQNASVVYVGSRDVFKSTDGGVNFTNITKTFGAAPAFTFNPANGNAHSDQHCLTITPAGVIYIGNDGGIYKSTDSGGTFTSLSDTLSLTQFVGLALHPTNSAITYGGAQDNGTQRRTTADPNRWEDFASGDGGHPVINSADPSMMWRTYVYGRVTRYLNNGDITSATTVATEASFGESASSPRIAFYPPVVGNGVDNKIYFGSWKLYVCSNCDTAVNSTAANWTAPGGATDLTMGGSDVLSAIGVAKSNIQIIYTGSAQGMVMVSTDGAANWSQRISNIPNRFISSIRVDPTNAAIAYLTVQGFGSGHIFKSTDTGVTWTNISGNLPNIPANASLIDPTNPNVLYLATDIGVFKSTIAGGTWASFNTGLPPVVVTDLVGNSAGTIQAATYGRGAYQAVTGGVTCNYSLSSTSQNISATGGNVPVTVTTTSGCNWSITGNPSWISVLIDSSGGVGTGITTLAVQANTTGSARNAVLTIAGQSFTVNQAAAAADQIAFSSPSFNGTEVSGIANITVNRTGDTSGTSTVDYLTSDGTALQTSDYEIASGTLTFAATETQKTFTVLINQDHIVEHTETFTVTLSNPINGSLGAQSTATVSITDDDSPDKSPVSHLFVADLSGSSVVPATNSTARAAAIVQLNQDETTASVSMTITSALNSTEMSASINGPAAAGANGPVAFTLPLGDFKDTEFLLTAGQAAQFKSGQFYITIQTQNSPNGEIRGQLLANPMDDARSFVQQNYYDFLARVPDGPGLDFWTSQITGVGTDPIQLRNKRVDVSNAFFYELEYQQTGSYVFRLYRAAYGNNQPFPNPDGTNLTESKKLPSYFVFSKDRARVIGGASLAQGQVDLANQFVQRAEFTGKYPLSLDGPGFVDAILFNIKTDTGVDLTGQRTALIALYNIGGRGAVVYRLADDNVTNPINNHAFIDEEYNRAFVATQYFGYLRRDADIGGFIFWLTQVNGAALRDVPRQHAMVCSFITSGEYQGRFSSVISRFNTECPQ